MPPPAAAAPRYRFGAFELQPAERRLVAGSGDVHLGAHAFDLLVALVERSGHLVTKDRLLEQVWGKVVVEENTLQVHISTLRKVLGAEAIATVSGRGYRFTLAVQTDAQERSRERKSNLPLQLTSFIGREVQVAQIPRTLASTRLLTLTGAGGCGKTRLALQVAMGIVDDYADGVTFVELAPISEGALLVQIVANAMAIREVHGPNADQILAQLIGPRQLLLILDNAEHLIDSCASLVEVLLRRCVGLTVLVTSRERLGIAGELTYQVPSLSVPEPSQAPSEALACEAARLFIERARLQRPELQVTDNDVPAIISICRRLDGIALAIELAAPRVRVMSMSELAQHLDHRFALLTEGSRTALPRHRTLRALIDWSHGLLTDAERATLRRASVFAGGWILEAAEHVCAGAGVDRAEILDLLTSLADKNLVVAETQGAVTRFSMLETVRHYASDRLHESGEEYEARSKHLDYFQSLARKLDDASSEPEREEWINRLCTELDNLRGALAWCEADRSRAEAGLLLAGRLYWMTLRTHLGEGRAWIERLLAVAPGVEKGYAHALAHHAAGTFASHAADARASEAHHRAALEIWQRLGDRPHAMRSLGSLGAVNINRGDLETARSFFEQALAIAREIGDRRGTTLSLYSLGQVAYLLGDLAIAEKLCEESVAVGREVRTWQMNLPITLLACVRRAQGRPEGTRAVLVEAAQGLKGRGPSLVQVLQWLAQASIDDGDLEGARQALREALSLHRAGGSTVTDTSTFRGFGELCATRAGLTAANLWGFAARLREESEIPLYPIEHQRSEVYIALARGALKDDAAFDRAWAEGRSWTVEHAMRVVMEI